MECQNQKNVNRLNDIKIAAAHDVTDGVAGMLKELTSMSCLKRQIFVNVKINSFLGPKGYNQKDPLEGAGRLPDLKLETFSCLALVGSLQYRTLTSCM